MARVLTSMRKWLHGKWGTVTLAAGGTAGVALLNSYLESQGVSSGIGMGTALAGYTALVNSLIGGIAANQMTDETNVFAKSLAGDNGILNHDLQKLIRAALAETCRQACGERNNQDANSLKKLADGLSEFRDEAEWESIVTDPRLSHTARELDPESAIQIFERPFIEQGEPSPLSVDDWKVAFGHIAHRLACSLSDSALQRVSECAHDTFPLVLRDLARRDFSEDGTRFAAVHLSVLGNLADRVQILVASADHAAVHRDRLRAILESLLTRFDVIKAHIDAASTDIKVYLETQIAPLRDQLSDLRPLREEHQQHRQENRDAHQVTQRELDSLRSDLSELKGNLFSPPVVAPVTASIPRGPINTLPAWDTSHFVNSRNVLGLIEGELISRRRVIISGEAGVGKTITALAVARSSRTAFQHKLWVRSGTADSLRTDLTQVHITASLGMQVYAAVGDIDRFIAQILERLATAPEPYLIVFDGVDDPSLLDRYLPRDVPHSYVLMTTIANAAMQYGATWGEVRIDKGLDEEEGALLLLRRAKRILPIGDLPDATAEDVTLARQVTRAVAGYPLVLEDIAGLLAGRQKRFSLQTIADEFPYLLSDAKSSVTGHDSAKATFTRGFDALTSANRVSATLLEICSWYADVGVPADLFTSECLDPGPKIWSRSEFLRAVNEACDHLLLRYTDEDRALTMHRVRQMLLRRRQAEAGRFQSAEDAGKRLAAAMPDFESSEFATYRALQPHIIALHRNTRDLPEAALPIELLCKSSLYCASEGAVELASELLKRAECEQARAPSASADVFLSIASAELKITERRYDDALEVLDRAAPRDLVGRVRVLNMIGRVLLHLGQVQKAMQRFQDVLDLIGDEGDISTAGILQNIALANKLYGDDVTAERLYQKSITVLAVSPGKRSARYAAAISNLATLYRDRGDALKAEPLYRESFDILKTTLGPDHPSVGDTMTHLGVTFEKLGRFPEARDWHHRAIALFEQAFGREHPSIGTALNNLAVATDDDSVAIEYLKRSLQMSSGPLDRAVRLHNLARCYESLMRLDEAVQSSQSAVEILEQSVSTSSRQFKEAAISYAMCLLKSAISSRDAEDSTRLATRVSELERFESRYATSLDSTDVIGIRLQIREACAILRSKQKSQSQFLSAQREKVKVRESRQRKKEEVRKNRRRKRR